MLRTTTIAIVALFLCTSCESDAGWAQARGVGVCRDSFDTGNFTCRFAGGCEWSAEHKRCVPRDDGDCAAADGCAGDGKCVAGVWRDKGANGVGEPYPACVASSDGCTASETCWFEGACAVVATEQ